MAVVYYLMMADDVAFSSGKKAREVVVKVTQQNDLRCEGEMLTYLAVHTGLPVPDVVWCTPELMVLEYLPTGGHINHTAEQHMADLLAELHTIHAEQYGFETDTLIGSLTLPNGWHDNWEMFFAEKRLKRFANLAHQIGHLPDVLLARVTHVADNIAALIQNPNPPSLVHGDLWSGNVLTRAGRITGILDPALYYADREVELAYISLFQTFGRAFWERYERHLPVDDGFWQVRQHVYSLYPLLVHVYYFAGSYVAAVEDKVARLEQVLVS